MMSSRLIPLLGLLALAGCAGTPTTYLTLSAQPSDRTYVATGAPVGVAHVTMPPSLDRLYLTTRLNDNQLNVANHTRWAAPLGGMTQRVLARDFATRLTGTIVLMPGDAPPRSGSRLVRVNVDRFIADQTGLVTLDADWLILSPRHEVIARNRARITVPGGKFPVAEAHSMSLAVGQLAEQIAARLYPQGD